MWIPTYFLFQAAKRRNALIIPENDNDLRIFDIGKVYSDSGDAYRQLPRVPVDTDEKATWAYLIVVVDIDTEAGKNLLIGATEYRRENPDTELVILHNPVPNAKSSSLSSNLFKAISSRSFGPFKSVDELLKILTDHTDHTDNTDMKDVATNALLLPSIHRISLKHSNMSVLNDYSLYMQLLATKVLSIK